MLTIKIDPTAVIKMAEEANAVGWPHQWVQVAGPAGEVTLSWEVDGAERGVRVTLHANGAWTAELDLP